MRQQQPACSIGVSIIMSRYRSVSVMSPATAALLLLISPVGLVSLFALYCAYASAR
jgi:hypothetical protein